jgi:hypothetical protein
MSAFPLAEFPEEATLSGSPLLERAILPAGLRVLPGFFFRWCWRLLHIDTSGCIALEQIGWCACEGCRSLKKFDFPRTIRETWRRSLSGTAIEEVDMTETVAESVVLDNMIFLQRVVLPRRCKLEDGGGLPALRILALGRSLGRDICFGSQMREIRFESFLAPQESAAGLGDARVHAEVAAAFTRESHPSTPP